MALKYEMNAAGLSIDSMLQQIKNASTIETEQYKMLQNSTATYIQMAETAKEFTQLSLENQASQLNAQGLSNIIGSAGSLIATGVCLKMSAKYESEASALEKPNEQETEVELRRNNSTEMAELDSGRAVAQGHATNDDPPVNTNTEAVQVNGRTEQETNNRRDVDEISQEEKEKKEKKEEAIKALRAQSNNWMNYGTMIPQSINGMVSGIGSMVQASYKKDEAESQSLATLYGQMPSVWNNMFGLQNGVISAEESNKQGDIGVWSSIIQASTGLRG